MTTQFYITSSISTPYALWFATVPPPSNIGNPQIEPFVVNISAADSGVHTINLYAQFSKSGVYQDPQNKWSHLVPQWRFTDLEGNHIESIDTIDTPISAGTQFVGVTGYAKFYYVDDLSTDECNPVILWATMIVSGLPLYSESNGGRTTVAGYSNSLVVEPLPYYVNGIMPHELEITRNGIDPLSAGLYWDNINIPAVITINGSNQNATMCGYTSKKTILFDYPSSNSLGLEMGEIDKAIVTLPLSAQIWTSMENGTSASYFQAYDVAGFRSGGYTRNTVIPNTTSFNAYITAGAMVQVPSIVRSTPFVWIANPDTNLLHKIYYPCVGDTAYAGITSWLEHYQVTKNISYTTPYLTSVTNIMGLSGFGGIYGMAVDQCYNVWCTDGEMDMIYKFNPLGTLLSSIDLSDTGPYVVSGIEAGCTPAGISLDENGSMWVTLFDSSSVLKFDMATGNLLTVINQQGNEDAYIDPQFKPTLAETDRDSNIWVSNTNTLCSCLYKYDTNGVHLSTIVLPPCSNPMDIVIDYDNNPWVTLTRHAGPPYFQGSVQQYDGATGSLLTDLTGYTHPEYITMDMDGLIWFTHDFNTVSKYDPYALSSVNLIIGTTAVSGILNNETMYFNALEGICCDSSDRIWVINSYDHRIFVIDNMELHSFELPATNLMWINLTGVQTVSSQWVKSLQAFGDWSGFRWLQKYTTLNVDTYVAYVTGNSGYFNIDSYLGYDIRKFNESWDTTNQMRDYALVPTFYDNYNLFVNYLGTMIGGLETSANSIGRRIYEKIANFVPNNADVETCEVPSIYSLSMQTDVPIDDYNFQYPVELQRIMNIVSIPHKKLWGDRCHCAHNFKMSYGLCTTCGHKHSTNIGNGIDTNTYVVSADVPFLAQYKFNRDYYELITPLNSSTTIYNTVTAYLLNSPADYCYYEYIPTPCNVQVEGVISWDDPYTTLNENVSGIEEWYGNGQTIEKIINYILHKNLGLD